MYFLSTGANVTSFTYFAIYVVSPTLSPHSYHVNSSISSISSPLPVPFSSNYTLLVLTPPFFSFWPFLFFPQSSFLLDASVSDSEDSTESSELSESSESESFELLSLQLFFDLFFAFDFPFPLDLSSSFTAFPKRTNLPAFHATLIFGIYNQLRFLPSTSSQAQISLHILTGSPFQK